MEKRKKSTPGTGKRSTHEQGKRTSGCGEDLPGEDWRDAVVVWTLVLTVVAEMDDVGRRL